MAERDERVALELRIVHAAGDDDLAHAVDALGGDPADIAALAGVQLGRRPGGDELAIFVLRLRGRDASSAPAPGRPVGHGEAERASTGP